MHQIAQEHIETDTKKRAQLNVNEIRNEIDGTNEKRRRKTRATNKPGMQSFAYRSQYLTSMKINGNLENSN